MDFFEMFRRFRHWLAQNGCRLDGIKITIEFQNGSQLGHALDCLRHETSPMMLDQRTMESGMMRGTFYGFDYELKVRGE